MDFYPRPPCGGRLVGAVTSAVVNRFLSTSPLRGTTIPHTLAKGDVWISIHVPLAGDDGCLTVEMWPRFYFYPRPPCGGRRGADRAVAAGRRNFYPRPPCGGRHISVRRSNTVLLHFYPRPPCGGRQIAGVNNGGFKIFLSTSPLRGTTYRAYMDRKLVFISIHVPLAGDDAAGAVTSAEVSKFLSTSPLRGTTPYIPLSKCQACRFLSTSPLRGTTPPTRQQAGRKHISIHVPLAGDDLPRATIPAATQSFLSTSPLRGTTPANGIRLSRLSHFYPRPPCGGRL